MQLWHTEMKQLSHMRCSPHTHTELNYAVWASEATELEADEITGESVSMITTKISTLHGKSHPSLSLSLSLCLSLSLSLPLSLSFLIGKILRTLVKFTEIFFFQIRWLLIDIQKLDVVILYFQQENFQSL